MSDNQRRNSKFLCSFFSFNLAHLAVWINEFLWVQSSRPSIAINYLTILKKNRFLKLKKKKTWWPLHDHVMIMNNGRYCDHTIFTQWILTTMPGIMTIRPSSWHNHSHVFHHDRSKIMIWWHVFPTRAACVMKKKLFTVGRFERPKCCLINKAHVV